MRTMRQYHRQYRECKGSEVILEVLQTDQKGEEL